MFGEKRRPATDTNLTTEDTVGNTAGSPDEGGVYKLGDTHFTSRVEPQMDITPDSSDTEDGMYRIGDTPSAIPSTRIEPTFDTGTETANTPNRIPDFVGLHRRRDKKSIISGIGGALLHGVLGIGSLFADKPDSAPQESAVLSSVEDIHEKSLSEYDKKQKQVNTYMGRLFFDGQESRMFDMAENQKIDAEYMLSILRNEYATNPDTFLSQIQHGELYLLLSHLKGHISEEQYEQSRDVLGEYIKRYRELIQENSNVMHSDIVQFIKSIIGRYEATEPRLTSILIRTVSDEYPGVYDRHGNCEARFQLISALYNSVYTNNGYVLLYGEDKNGAGHIEFGVKKEDGDIMPYIGDGGHNPAIYTQSDFILNLIGIPKTPINADPLTPSPKNTTTLKKFDGSLVPEKLLSSGYYDGSVDSEEPQLLEHETLHRVEVAPEYRQFYESMRNMFDADKELWFGSVRQTIIANINGTLYGGTIENLFKHHRKPDTHFSPFSAAVEAQIEAARPTAQAVLEGFKDMYIYGEKRTLNVEQNNTRSYSGFVGGVDFSCVILPNAYDFFSVNTLRYFANDQDTNVRSFVARNSNTPPETLRVLANDQDSYVRLFVAENSNTPPETLRVLANDQDSYVRLFVAENSNTPPETLRVLANDQDSYVPLSVATNSNTPPETLRALANDQDSYVPLSVATNSNTPPETLRALAKNQDTDVRLSVATNSNTPPETLRALANDQDSYVRLLVARNPNTPVETLEVLAKDPETSVQKTILLHTNIPPSVWRILKEHKGPDVQELVFLIDHRGDTHIQMQFIDRLAVYLPVVFDAMHITPYVLGQAILYRLNLGADDDFIGAVLASVNNIPSSTILEMEHFFPESFYIKYLSYPDIPVESLVRIASCDNPVLRELALNRLFGFHKQND